MAVLVELYGFPGAGKTTICKMVMDRLNEAGKKTTTYADYRKELSILRLSWLRALALYRALKDHDLEVAHIRSTGQWKVSKLVRLYLLWQREVYTEFLLSVSDYDVVLFDQWTIQGLWSLFAFETDMDEEFVTGKIGTNSRGIRYVYIDAPVDVCSERIASRRDCDSRFEGTVAADVAQMIQPSASMMSYLHNVLCGVAVHLIEVDATQPLTHNASRIADWVMQGEGGHG